LIAREAENLLRPETRPQNPQGLRVVVQRKHPAVRLHFLREQPGARAAVKQRVGRLRRARALNPPADEPALAGVIPVLLLEGGDVVVFGGVHGDGKTLFRGAEFSKFKSVPRPASSPSHGFLVTLAVLLALAHAVMAVTATADKSMTSDEIAHLTAGHAYNLLGDFRVPPENGNLPQRWAALPLALAGAPLPPTSLQIWRDADVWRYGHALFYEQALPTEEPLFAGRAMIALFSAATGLLVFFW